MFDLEEVITKDGLLLQGLVSLPKEGSKTVLVWVHGLTGSFYGNKTLLTTLSTKLAEENVAFASFNTRGHDMIAGFKKITDVSKNSFTYATIGAGYEVFEECIDDIDAVIAWFLARGYTKVFLAGHSSGANKVSYFQGTTKHPHVAGVVLLSPMSDRLYPGVDGAKKQKAQDLSRTLLDNGKGDELHSSFGYFPMTAKRFASLSTPRSQEDQFGYGDIPPYMPEYSKIKAPLLVVLANDDEYKDRPILEIKEVFDNASESLSYESKIIEGATHGFEGKIFEVVSIISRFIKQNL